MARARNIKPGFFANPELVELPFEVRLLFIGLWTLADRAGRLEDRPKKIKMAVFPADNVDVEAGLAALACADLLTRYEAEGERYIEITTFTKHQHPHKDEKASTIPAPCGHHASTVQPPAEHGGNPPESLLLIPDSPIADTPKVDAPDGASPPKPKKPKVKDPECPEDADPQVWADWLSLRRKKSAPVTQTVIDGARGEAEKAGMTLTAFLRVWCLRGSQGLEAAWLRPEERGKSPPSGETSWQRSQRDRVNEFAPGIAKQAPDHLNTIDEGTGNVITLASR